MNPERIENIKTSIHTYLENCQVYDSIRDIVDAYLNENPNDNASSSDGIIRVLKERGIFQSLLSSLSENTLNTSFQNPYTWGIKGGEQYLHVKLTGGRAFVDFLTASPKKEEYRLYVTFHFGSQRYRSVLLPCSSDPAFSDDFLFHLNPGAFGFSSQDLIEISTPLHIGVFCEDSVHNTSELLGENILDWRKVLSSGFLGVTTELCGSNPGVPSGIIDLELELVPKSKKQYTESEIYDKLDQQRAVITSADREFLLYSRRWWSEFQSIRPGHCKRKVKIFSSTTNGRMVPVNHFISPLQGGDLVSPGEAARFVSLLPQSPQLEDPQFLERIESNKWLSSFVFLSQRQGHSSNHANLLCSLLLGFGLDAYCAIGTTSTGDTKMFVCTNISSHNEMILWDPLSGERNSINGPHSISTIDCLYNHKSFYANIQQSSELQSTIFDVNNEELWKPINPLKLRLVPKFPNSPLLSSSFETFEIEKGLEFRLRAAITSHRDTIGVQTFFDANLSYIMTQALVNYEQQKIFGSQPDFSFFQDSVKGTVGPGMTFKAVPINIANEDETIVMNMILSHNTGTQILNIVGEDVRFGIRVKVFGYPEGVRSVWIMLASVHRIRV